MSRTCCRTGCLGKAASTLTYVYAEQTAVLGPLAPARQPGSYDLCSTHASSTRAPQGWQTIHLAAFDEPPPPDTDDLLALADAIREVGMSVDEPTPAATPRRFGDDVVVLAERRHLTVIAER